MILVDLSQTIMSGVIINLAKDLSRPNVDVGSLIRHMVYSTLLSYKTKFGKEYGQMVLCADSKKYWRREYFPWYKGHRKHDRDKSPIDWNTVFGVINEIKAELREYFPYKVLEIEGAEADDVIASMCKWLQDNELKEEGLFGGEPQSTLLISSDGDFVQLQKYKNVVQWNPQHKKWVKTNNVHEYLIEHICTGDAGDNIPNMLTSDSWAQDRSTAADDKIRQTPFRKTRLDEFIENGEDACQTESERRNFIRNRTLVDFSCIPEPIYNSVVSEYSNYEKRGSKMKLMSFFTKHKMKVLFSEVDKF